jgi:DNA-binding MarR family transcriptional regulator
MATEPNWLDTREDRAWRTFVHVHHRLRLRLHQHLLNEFGLTETDYEILVALSEHPGDCMPAQELCGLLQWEKSRLSHQTRRMEERGLIARETNPSDARSTMICLLPAGRAAIEEAAPRHVDNVRRHFIDLLSPAELDVLAAVQERVLDHLAEDAMPEERDPTDRTAQQEPASSDT